MEYRGAGVIVNHYPNGKVYIVKGGAKPPHSHMKPRHLEEFLDDLPELDTTPPTQGVCSDASITRKHGVQIRVTDATGKMLRPDVTWRRKVETVSTTTAELYGIWYALKWFHENRKSRLARVIYCDNSASVGMVNEDFQPRPESKTYELNKWLLARIRPLLRIGSRHAKIRYWDKRLYGKEIPADFGRK